jgi:predicted amidohydrolase YtcJ
MKYLLFFIICLVALAAQSQQKADLVMYNANIYTADEQFSKAQALAVSKGRIIAVGSSAEILKAYTAMRKLDAKEKTIIPGFIDAHAHFLGYGLDLDIADLTGSKSWDEVIHRLQAYAATYKEGWLTGRGWDQNLWGKEFPDNEQLNRLFPDRAVVLTRVDGHAAIANQKALDLSGVKAGDTLIGGKIEVKNGKLTGILIDNATDLVYNHKPQTTREEALRALLAAQKNCFAVGLTTVDDCGLDYEAVMFIDSLQRAGALKMRLYTMLSDAPKNYEFARKHGKIKTERLNVRAFKLYADGALGSRGACLLQPYSDKPGWQGFLLSAPAHFDSVVNEINSLGFQVCTHAIGDSGNRFMLQLYSKYLKGKNDKRWRIEHTQVVNNNDFKLFGHNSIIPSVQPTHATSDMYWAEERLGNVRIKGAYAYNDLMKQNGWIPLGTDFPVEDISPIKTFYAAVVRKDAKGWPAKGFQVENALSRLNALKGMTTWAARANFEEKEKGSLEKGMMADFVILSQDIMTVPANEILKTKVLMTVLNGEKVYSAPGF